MSNICLFANKFNDLQFIFSVVFIFVLQCGFSLLISKYERMKSLNIRSSISSQ
eukprot:UN17925